MTEIDNEKLWADTLMEYFQDASKAQVELPDDLDLMSHTLINELRSVYNEQSIADIEKWEKFTRSTFNSCMAYCVALLNKKYNMLPEDSYAAAHNVARAKHHDYGSGPILNFGVVGLLIRVSDKLSRIERLLDESHEIQVSESLKDTLLDIINYSAYVLILLDNRWIS
jgi:hypothetical protein